MKPKGLLVLQLGTPAAPTIDSVRTYLREFLSDPYVIDLPAPIRWMLLEGFILPKRAKASTALYQKIWTPEGSPLRVHGEKLRAASQTHLGPDWLVTLGMRYQEPSIEQAVQTLIAAECREIVVFPLFPQYAQSSTKTALLQAQKYLRPYFAANDIHFIQEYYEHPAFIEAQARQIQESLMGKDVDHVLMSFHGIPIRHLKKACLKPCSQTTPCPIGEKQTTCYRAHCYGTARAIAAQLGWSEDYYTIGFQSRLGRTPWIEPYTDQLLPALAQKSIKKLAIVAPSFVADCLETLEELNIRAREDWEKLGGSQFHFVPALNEHPLWVRAIGEIIQPLVRL